MGSYLQNYGAGEEQRNRIIKRTILITLAVIIVGSIFHWIFHNYPEKQLVKKFLAELNQHEYKKAYSTWNCEADHTCRYYDYDHFLQDWGPSKKTSSPWKIASVDGCRAFVTVNVQAQGAELQSLAVTRGVNGIGFAPAPECQERKIRLGRFFHRLFHGTPPPGPGEQQQQQ